MKNVNGSKTSIKDIGLWLSIGLITIICFGLYYWLDFSGPIKAIVGLSWLLVIGALGYFTSKGMEVFGFFKDAKIELQKVVWPTKQETIQITGIVMLMVVVTGFILWALDSLMIWTIAKLTHLG